MQPIKFIKISLCKFLPITQAVTIRNAEDGFTTLQKWYNQSSGLWIPSTGWWNSANCLTIIADLAAIDPWVRQRGKFIWRNTFTKAQKYNMQMEKLIEPGYLPCSYYANSGPPLPQNIPKPQAHRTNGFLNDYYDDEGWWALAWLAVYDVTGSPQYLSTAQSIFADMHAAYNTTPCGGLWWDKQHTYVNAIANELYISVAAHLATRSKDGAAAAYYLDLAKEAWAWFLRSGLINSQWNIDDGLDGESCGSNNGTVWTYNQGVILGALAELSRATGESEYIVTAKRVADAGIVKLTNSTTGILHEPCEPDCGNDGPQFKGIYARNLRILQQQSPEDRFTEFLERNADSVWDDSRNEKNEFGLVWDRAFDGAGNASAQSSGLDIIVAALSMEVMGYV